MGPWLPALPTRLPLQHGRINACNEIITVGLGKARFGLQIIRIMS